MAPLLAAAGCVLPWVHEEVGVPGGNASSPLNGFHRIGVAACVGAALGLLAAADRLRRERWHPLDDSLAALGGTLVTAGAFLFLTPLGQPLGHGTDGTWSVTLGAGLPLAAAAGVLLLSGCALAAAGRRAASPPPGSAG